ncbi:MAG: gliding motility-associated C-terminal domain-containing protein [Bacteroidales bacterium]|nr:gliding motility-associated C-terminal domain-containing protein [Bacteroidales bacterium]MBN2632575.1 gliding motility-associated C-terminal domain-containing protein [Bacteroidales bacterium]
MKKILAICLFIVNAVMVTATHNRAGEITYKQLSALTYEITITTFTYTLSLADRDQLDVDWGDNSMSTAPRVSRVVLPNYYQRNIYVITHTFPGPGVYKIVVQDPNRNFGVKNIPNSVNVVFSIATTLTVNPAMGFNNTPVLLNPPYDKAALGYVFIHNPAAYDPDGDSLSYALTTCTREDGKPIENYTLPPATRSITVDPLTGDLIWDTPADTGIYNVAMEIQEWRNGKKIGSVVRDMQIEVFVTSNKPPVNGPLSSICVEAGEIVDFTVSATDENNDRISLRATSGIFGLQPCPALFSGIDSVPGYSTARFIWTPCHEAVRNQPYNIIFKADDDNAELKLSDIDNMTIKVLGPPPELLSAVPEGKFIRLTWSPYGTAVIAGFAIYRRIGASTFDPDSCTSGVPASTGFIKAGYIDGSSTVEFTDTNNGLGLDFGEEYTYRIVAVYPNGTESKSSNELTSTLISGIPVIRNVSVRNTHPENGSIYLAWKKPDRLDTIPGAAGPYEYLISRAQGVAGDDFSFITSITTTDLNDTVFIDTLINTRDYGHLYKIVLWNRSPGNEFVIGDTSYASSTYITLSPGDRKMRFVISRNVPWINTAYDFFRYNETTSEYDSVGTTNQLTFTDPGLENGLNYCYYVRSTGGYQKAGLPVNLINFSQTACAVPVDNEPPCVPDIRVTSNCEELYNTVSWSFADSTCLDDVVGYKIYYKLKFDDSPLDTIKTINDKYQFSYNHYPGEIIAGCYGVKAFDANGNESLMSTVVCIDSCQFYEIPNVFTPNNDGKNDKLVARTSGLVEKVDFKIFNRNGLLIFSTDRPRIEWDGTYRGDIVSPGVYFYQCDVFERRITGLEQFHISGFVHIITEKGIEITPQQTK